MESAGTLTADRICGYYCLTHWKIRYSSLRAALPVLLLIGAAWTLRAQPAAGHITTRGIVAGGLSVIDAQQNVHIAAGGGCAGFMVYTCVPLDIVKVNAAGDQVFRTRVNGQEGILPKDLAVDPAGNIYVLVTSWVPGYGAFVAKLSADGSTFLYRIDLPATLAYYPAAIRLDAQGNAYIAGMTADFHPFVTKLNAAGSAFLYTAQLAGSGASATNPEKANALAVDAAGNAVVTGQTSSPDFPVTAGVLQPSLAGGQSAFVTKFDPTGQIVFSTFLGGTGGAYGQAIQMDSAGSIYVAGDAGASFPTTPGTYEPVAVVPLWSQGTVGFVAKVKPDASAITWATYTTSNGVYPLADPIRLALSTTGEVYVASSTGAGFQTTASAPQPCFGGDFDVVVVHLNAQGGLADTTYLGAWESQPTGLTLPGDGSVLLAAATGKNGAVLARITFGQPGWSAPACLSPQVLNAATFVSGVSPGEFVSLAGFGIGPQIGVAYQPGPQGETPLSLGGVQVSFSGIPAPLVYVQSRQVNAQVPFEVSGTTASVTLAYDNSTFGPYVVGIATFGPQGIFRLQPGVSTQAAALNQDGSVNGSSHPAARGSVVSLFGTGYGPLNPPCATGALNPPGPAPLFYPGTADNGAVGAPVVLYAGGAPTLLCGIVQVNMQVPLNAPSGPFLVAPNYNPGHGSTIFVQ
jgi:uncharacterized protein (TIGR03437 family)